MEPRGIPSIRSREARYGRGFAVITAKSGRPDRRFFRAADPRGWW